MIINRFSSLNFFALNYHVNIWLVCDFSLAIIYPYFIYPSLHFLATCGSCHIYKFLKIVLCSIKFWKKFFRLSIFFRQARFINEVFNFYIDGDEKKAFRIEVLWSLYILKCCVDVAFKIVLWFFIKTKNDVIKIYYN